MRTLILASAAALSIAACTGADVDDTAEMEINDVERTEVLSEETFGEVETYDDETAYGYGTDEEAYDTDLDDEMSELGNDIEYGTERAIDETDEALEETGDELERMGDEIEDDLDDPM